MGDGDTLINALVGAIATALLSGFVPFAPLFGGALAGYLEGGTRDDGLRVGVFSGLIGLVLAAVLFALVGSLFAFTVIGMGPGPMMGSPRTFGFGGLFLLVAALIGAVYIVGLSALGGWLGNYVRYDTGIGS